MIHSPSGNGIASEHVEIDLASHKATITVNTGIFPPSSVFEAAHSFSDEATVIFKQESPSQMKVELQSKNSTDPSILAHEFQNVLLHRSAKDAGVILSSKPLLARIRETVEQFITEEKGKISKNALLSIGAILGTLGMGSLAAHSVAATHCDCTTGDCGGGGECGNWEPAENPADDSDPSGSGAPSGSGEGCDCCGCGGEG